MTALIQEYKDLIDRNLRDKTKPWSKWFDQLELKTGLDRFYIFGGILLFTGLYLVFGFGAELVCNGIGFLYPAYMSIGALESPAKDDDTKWLTYWVTFACFSLVEYFADFIVGWFPMYWLSKCAFMIWCFMPGEYNGSLVMYRRVIRPYYLKYHRRIDAAADQDLKDLVKGISHKIDKTIDKGLNILDKKLDQLHQD